MFNKKPTIQSFKTIFKKKGNNNFLEKALLSKMNFGSKHSASGSESDDHSHDHHDDHHHPQERKFYDDYRMKEPRNVFEHLKEDKLNVLELIEKLREPVTIKKNSYKVLSKKEGESKSTAEIEAEYTEFLAKCFQDVTSKKYPEYKEHLEEFKNSIPNYDSLNPYEREVKTLKAYMNWRIVNYKEGERSNDRENNFTIDEAKKELLDKLTKISDNDTNIMAKLKKKLKKVVSNNAKYKDFLKKYNSDLENKALEKIVEKQKFAYVEIESLKTNKLSDLKSSLNPHFHAISVDPHDEIEIDNWKTNSNRLEAEKDKYLAMYDIILDQYLSNHNPDNLKDEPFKYMNKNNVPTEEYRDDWADNTIFDYKCRLDNEFFIKFKSELNKFLEKCEDNEERTKVS